MASERNIRARRLLSDLFKEGVEVRFWRGEDGKPVGKIGPFLDEHGKRIPPTDEEVAMYVTPPDPVQRDMAIRSGQGKRAAALVKAKRDENSEEYLTIMAFLADMSDESLIEYVVLGDTAERRAEAEREVLAYDEWKDMTAYQEAMRQFVEMEPEQLVDNEEYEALMELDEKYGNQVADRERELADAQREALGMIPREQVERKALEKRANIVGSQAFMAEYERMMLYFSIRDADAQDKLFFADADEASAQPDQVRELLEEALLPYITETGEAKNLQRAASGSDSSELPANPETSDSSTQKELTA
jgi:hypothetical protein